MGTKLDDFGTGYGSLSPLKRFPLSRLKVDRSFVKDICDDRAYAAVVTAMAHLASSLKIEVIAEGVETKKQSAMLQVCGSGIAQGYLDGRPMPAGELLALIGSKYRLAA